MVVCTALGKPMIFIFSVLEMSTEVDTSLAASRIDRIHAVGGRKRRLAA